METGAGWGLEAAIEEIDSICGRRSGKHKYSRAMAGGGGRRRA
jgi:hypothetical protein